MKILIVFPKEYIYTKWANPFVAGLIEALQSAGNSVECGIEEFWRNYMCYDVIFVQWPEVFGEISTADNYGRLEEQLKIIKSSGIKIVTTCHNLYPHNQNKAIMRLYDIVYRNVDAFHHMGKYSYALFKDKYPEKYHFIVPHHVANSLFDNSYDKMVARRRLGIPESNTVIASFGAFRNKDEELLFRRMAFDVGKKHKTYLAPRLSPDEHLYNGRLLRKSVKYVVHSIQYWWLNIMRYSSMIEDDIQAIWLAASDVVFIQRKKILNSGNIPLAFSAGKVVVGPDVGNVGYLLHETGNFFFNPMDRNSVKTAVLEAISASKLGIRGKENFALAKREWNILETGRTLTSYMKRLSQESRDSSLIF